MDSKAVPTLGIVSLIFGCVFSYPQSIPIGIILKKNEQVPATIVRYALWNQQRSSAERSSQYTFEILKETVVEEDPAHMDKAICRLLKRGIVAFVTPTSPKAYPSLVAYSNEFQIPLISPELPESSPDLSPSYAVGIQPSTTRPVLDLIRYYRWKEIVYLYDHEYGAEKLHRIFVLGYRVLNLRLIGMLKVVKAEDANAYLLKLDSNGKQKQQFHVILDVDPVLAKNIIVRHVHDARVRKRNFHFLVSNPVEEEYWTTEAAEFSIVNVTGFLAIPRESKAKSFNEEWKTLSPTVWEGAGVDNLNMSSYFYYDAARVLAEGFGNMRKILIRQTYRPNSEPTFLPQVEPRDCHEYPPIPFVYGARLASSLKEVYINDGLTGKLHFYSNGQRKDFRFTIVESKYPTYHELASWSDLTGFRLRGSSLISLPTPLPRTGNGEKLRITTTISVPYMMLKPNSSYLTGNDRFEGFCKDFIDEIARELEFEYELKLVDDGNYGSYNKEQGKWTGIIGELIGGKADFGVADLSITAKRQRVVDFTDPFESVSLSLVMKDPSALVSTSSASFFLGAFTYDVWLCIIAAVVLFGILFYFVTRWTGSPDSIESATGIWNRRFTPIISAWFTLGSTVMQDTGVYPRSISTRLLGGVWWFFSLIIASLYIASITSQMHLDSSETGRSPQLEQLQALSMESIISESISRGWPKIGLLRVSSTAKFIEKSIVPHYMELASYARRNPDVLIRSLKEGMDRVRMSKGHYMMLVGSTYSDYLILQQPCDVVATHDSASYVGYGIAFPLGSHLRSDVNDALHSLKQKGILGHLHRKWWIDSNQCRKVVRTTYNGMLHSVSGLFYALLAGAAVLLLVSVPQYLLKIQNRENRRRRLSLEDMNIDPTTLPLPPAELLEHPPPIVERSGATNGNAETGPGINNSDR